MPRKTRKNHSLKISAELDRVRQHLSDVGKLRRQDKEQQQHAGNGEEDEEEKTEADEGASEAAA